MSICFIEYIKNVPEPLKMMSSWGINQVWEFRFICLKNNNLPNSQGSEFLFVGRLGSYRAASLWQTTPVSVMTSLSLSSRWTLP